MIGDDGVINKIYLLIIAIIIILPFIHIGILDLIRSFINLDDNYIVNIINSYTASLIVLIGVLITINQSKKQDKENFRLEHMPYIEIEYVNGITKDCDTIISFGEYEKYNHEVIGYLKISNNGFGPATGLSLKDISFNYESLNMSRINEKILKPDDEIKVLFQGFFNLPSLDNRNVKNDHLIDTNIGPLYFDLEFKDFLGNEYTDEVQMLYSFTREYDELGNAINFSIWHSSIKKKRTRTKILK